MDELIRANYWWETGRVSDNHLEEYRRDIFPELAKDMWEKQICGIVGARRTGKTTLMYQLIHCLLEDGVEPERILMYSFDNPLMSDDVGIIKKILEVHNEMYHVKGPRYVFLDEIQYVEDWSRWVKSFYDRNEEIKFVVSGSSGKLIYKNTSESLTGRVSFYETNPFSFGEYCKYNGDNDLIKFVEDLSRRDPGHIYSKDMKIKVKHYQEDLKRLFNDYILYGGIPETFRKEPHITHKWLKEDYVGLVFYRDLMELFDIRDIRTLEELFYYIANTHGQRANYSKIGDMLDCRVETVKTYLGYLEIASLVHIVEHYSKSPKKSKRAEKKLYVSDSGILNAVRGGGKNVLADSKVIGSMVEGIVCSHMVSQRSAVFPKNVFYWRSVHELDFVVKQGNELIPVEVKYTSRIRDGDLKGLLSFMDKYRVEEGIVLTKEDHETKKIHGKKIRYIPVWFFLLRATWAL